MVPRFPRHAALLAPPRGYGRSPDSGLRVQALERRSFDAFSPYALTFRILGKSGVVRHRPPHIPGWQGCVSRETPHSSEGRTLCGEHRGSQI